MHVAKVRQKVVILTLNFAAMSLKLSLNLTGKFEATWNPIKYASMA